MRTPLSPEWRRPSPLELAACSRRCPSDVRRPRRTGRASASGCCFDELVLRRPRRRPRPRPARRGWPWSTWPASRVLVTRGRRRRAARVLQRLPAPGLAGRAGRPAADHAGACAVGALRCPYHSWTYDLDGRLLRGAAHRGRRRLRPGGVRAAPGRGRHLGRLPLPAPDAGQRGRRSPRDALGVAPSGSRATRSSRSSSGDAAPTTSPPTTRSLAGELQRVLPLRPVPPRADAAGAGVRPRRRRTSTGRTASRTARAPGPSRRPAPPTARRSRARRRRAEPAQGRAGLPEPDAVLRPPTTSRRSRSWPIGDRTAPGSCATCCSQPDEVAADDVRPARRGRPLGPGQPAGLGGLRVGAARHVVARLHAGLVRADGGRVRRHPALAAAAAGASRESSERAASGTTRSSSGSAGSGSATAWQLATARPTRCSGSSSSSSGTSAAPRTTRRGSCGAATTRRRTSR